MQKIQIVGSRQRFWKRNLSFLIKYGVLVGVLSLSYLFNDPQNKDIVAAISAYEQELSKNKQNILPLYNLIIRIL